MSKLLEKLKQFSVQKAQQTALSSPHQQLNYEQLSSEIERVSAILSDFQGKTLALEISNLPAWIIIDLACIKNFICTVPIPAFFTASQRQHALKSSGCSAILNDHKKGNIILYYKQHAIYCDPLEIQTVSLPASTAKVTYTSGSTGEPKGVCLSLNGIEQVAASLVEVLPSEIGAHTACVLPLPVLLENIAGCYATLLSGGCYHLQPLESIGFSQPFEPDFDLLVEYLVNTKASSCILTPELLRGLMQALVSKHTGLPDMQYIAVGGSKVSDRLLAQAQSLGLPVYQGYGLSESASVMAINRPGRNKSGAVGQLLPHIELLMDYDKKDARSSEIMIKNTGFLGYINNAGYERPNIETPPKVLKTGDLGKLDKEGFILLDGRKNNLLITTQGRNISPEWPESELLGQAEILQAMVVGDAQPYLSALIVPSPNCSSEQIDRAISLANSHLAEYAQIRRYLLIPPFTLENRQLTGTGRIRRKKILMHYATHIQSIYQNED